MEPTSLSSSANAASSAPSGSVREAAAMSVLKKAISVQAEGTMQLLAALPQPALATSGSLGTRLNVVV
jgi:hypothetical protein